MRKIIIHLFLIIFIVPEANAFDQRFTIQNDNNNYYLQIILPENYKIYWLYPGEYGFATSIDFTKSKNLADKLIKWPFPKMDYAEDNTKYYYYEGLVNIPLYLKPEKSDLPIELNLDLEYLVCGEQQCFPVKQNISEQIIITESNFTPNKFFVENITLRNNQLSFVARFDDEIEQANFLLDSKKRDFVKSTEIIKNSPRDFLIKMDIDPWLLQENEVMQYEIYSDQADLPAHLTIPNHYFKDLLIITIFAVFGGFILNFMPCVLPVLSLKAFVFIKNPQINRKSACIAIILGVITTFLLLALITITLKASGNYFGFGTNFQNPQFIIALCIILTIFISSALDRIKININFNLETRYFNNYHIENFFSGVLAAVLSTPCNAPFLGTAMAMAMIGNNLVVIYSFLLVGLGFSLPYFLIIFNPHWLNILPKPGKWMMVLKKLLAVMLIFTLIWLLGIIFAQLGFRPGVILAGLLFILKYLIEA